MKDYWNISKRNFRALGIICILAIILIGLGIMQPGMVNTANIITLVLLIISCVFMFTIAGLFKKKSPTAIKAFNIYLIIWAIGFILPIIINPSSLINGLIGNILSILIVLYLWDCVRKAKKQIPA